MAGSKEGAAKAKAKLLARDPDYFKKMGKRGAEVYRNMPKDVRRPRGFAHPDAKPSEAGKLGGLKSRRGPAQ